MHYIVDNIIDICKSIVEFKNITVAILLYYYYLNFDKIFEFNIIEIFSLLSIDIILSLILIFFVCIYFISGYEMFLPEKKEIDFMKIMRSHNMNIVDCKRLMDISVLGNKIYKINLGILTLSNWHLTDTIKVIGEDILLIGFFDAKFTQYKYVGLFIFVLMHSHIYESLGKLLYLGIKYIIVLNFLNCHLINYNIYHVLFDILVLSLLSITIKHNKQFNIINLIDINNIDNYITNMLYFSTNLSLYTDLMKYKDKFPRLSHVINLRYEILKFEQQNEIKLNKLMTQE